MKKNSVELKYIFNPFLKYSEQKLLVTGLLGWIMLNVICVIFNHTMNGLLHFSTHNGSWIDSLKTTNIVLIINILIFYLLGKIINRKTRFIDILNAILVGIIPLVLITGISEIPIFANAFEKVGSAAYQLENFYEMKWEMILIAISSFIILPLLVYAITLMFNGFRVATNSKNGLHIALFFIVLFILNSITQFYF